MTSSAYQILRVADWESTSVAIAVVVMGGIILAVVVWQLLAIARDRANRERDPGRTQ